jgi:hypothetical protein
MTMKRRAMLGLAVTAAVAGVVDVLFGTAGHTTAVLIDIAILVAFLSLVFVWMHFDSIEIGFRRSPLLNAGVLALPLVFFPVYLVRSRPKGNRLPAVLGCIAFFVLLLFVATAFSFGTFLFGGFWVAT